MDRYDIANSNGRTVVARFCKCGHAAVIAAISAEEFSQFDRDWKQSHTGLGHEQVDFDGWIVRAMLPCLALAS
jgi:hypothetical protein